jgi:hypothetical protein
MEKTRRPATAAKHRRSKNRPRDGRIRPRVTRLTAALTKWREGRSRR